MWFDAGETATPCRLWEPTGRSLHFIYEDEEPLEGAAVTDVGKDPLLMAGVWWKRGDPWGGCGRVRVRNTDGLPGGGGEQPGLGYSLRVEPMGQAGGLGEEVWGKTCPKGMGSW